MSHLEPHVWRSIPRGKVYLCTADLKNGARCFAEAVVRCRKKHQDRNTVEMVEANGECDTAKCQRHAPRKRSNPCTSSK